MRIVSFTEARNGFKTVLGGATANEIQGITLG